MPNQYLSLLTNSTVARLQSYGLDLLIEYDKTNGKDSEFSALRCKHTSNECVWAGIDNKDTPLINPTDTIDRLVANYCRETLSCMVDDIIWCLVESCEDKGTRYKVVDATGRWGDKKYTLMYMLKQGVIKAHQVDSISHCFEQDLKNMMRDHAIEYTAWLNNEMLKLTIVNKQKAVKTPIGNELNVQYGVIPLAKEIDTYSNQLIDEVLSNIGYLGNSSVNIILYTDRDMPSYIDKQLYFIRTMEHVFGFTPALGYCDFNVQDRIFDINMSLDSLPPFSVLKTHPVKNIRGEDFEIIDRLKQSICWLGDNEHFEMPSIPEIMDNLMYDKPYSEWPPVLLTALVLTLSIPIGEMQLEEISMHLTGEDSSSEHKKITTTFY